MDQAAWMAYLLMDRSDWRVLPEGGGWFQQDEGLLDSVSTLARMSMYVRAQLDVNEAEADNG